MGNITLKISRYLLLTMLVFGITAPAPGEAAPVKVYTLAIFPSATPANLHRQWAPFVKRLSNDTGFEFRLRMYEIMADFERDIWSGHPDFIFASPIQTVVAHQANGYVPLVRGGKKVAVGLFVRADSPIRTVDDLAGKSISFVGNKNMCSVFIQHLLGQKSPKLSFSREYAGSTRNVIINVLLGKSAAGAVFSPELARESEDARKQLREIMATADIAPHPLSANPRVSRSAQEAVTKATLAIAATKEGAQLLKALMLETPVAANYDRDYRFLEEIDIKGLTNWGQ